MGGIVCQLVCPALFESDVADTEIGLTVGKVERQLTMQATGYLDNMAASTEQVVSNKEAVFQAEKDVYKRQEAQLTSARQNLGFCTVTSPSDGVVGTFPYRIGSLVSPSVTQPLTTVSEIGEMYVYFSMTEDVYKRQS